MVEAPSLNTLFIDLDGTLTDPKPGITGCIQYALQRLSETVPPAEDLLWCIGPPLVDSFSLLVGEKRAQRAVEFYRERFGDIGLFENAVYHGIPETLQNLRDSHLELFVASSKPLVYVRRILEHFSLDNFFDDVFGSELDGTRTDKTELLAHALECTGAYATRSAMIGDRRHDIVGARNNRMHATGVLYGYGSREELNLAGATRIAVEPADLVSLHRHSG